MKTLQVKTQEQNYDILIHHGLLAQTGELVKKVWKLRKIALVSDDNVAPLYMDQVKKSLTQQGFRVFTFVIPHGEQSKSLTELAKIIKGMALDRFNRSDGVIALGGGVVGDLAGFVSAVYMRGIDLIQIPTSFLSQVDSSVGGKTAVDLDDVKNLVGSFHQPDLVIIDPNNLKTLPKRDLVEGYGEDLKVAALNGGAFWQLVQKVKQPSDLLKYADQLILFAIKYKALVVSHDAHESGERQVLNFGHTIGHGVEALAAGKLRHGEAVSIGLIAMTKIFEKQGLSPQGMAAKLKQRLAAVGLPTSSKLVANPHLIDKIKSDKKNHNGYLNVIYLKAFGQPVIKPLSIQQINQKIKNLIQK